MLCHGHLWYCLEQCYVFVLNKYLENKYFCYRHVITLFVGHTKVVVEIYKSGMGSKHDSNSVILVTIAF